MAAKAVVASLLANLCREAGVAPAAHPTVDADAAQDTVIVRLDVDALEPRADALHDKLHAVLDPLPCKVEIRRAPLEERGFTWNS
jgi:hypothetical protein